jgi:hypothetical protein
MFVLSVVVLSAGVEELKIINIETQQVVNFFFTHLSLGKFELK